MKYHFLGIGGVGISALARICLEKGFKVEGSDRLLNEYVELLRKRGAKIFLEEEPFSCEKGQTIIYGSAIKKTHPHLVKAQKQGSSIFHRAEFLAHLMQGYEPILVTGTHGKTTTTSLLAWIFSELQLDPTYVLGGKLKKKDTNAQLGKGRVFIAEADESDGTFLRLPCKAAIITNLEEDHLDFWGSYIKLEEAFSKFFHKVHPSLCIFGYYPNLKKIAPHGFSLGWDPKADFVLTHFSQTETGFTVDITFQGKTFSSLKAPLIGRHNAENVAFAFAFCILWGLSEELVREAIQAFPGVSRRLDLKGETKYATLLDDYAHHPTEIQVALSSVKEAYFPRRVVAIFEPHRYSRFVSFQKEFFSILQEADLVLVTEVFSAGEKRPKSWNLRKELEKEGFFYIAKKDLLQKLSTYLQPYDVVLLFNAGDLSSFSSSIIEEVFPKIRAWNIGICFGGRSKEYEISWKTASFFEENIKKLGFSVTLFPIDKRGNWEKESLFSSSTLRKLQACDIIVPSFHGPFGEDGMIQGFLQTLGLPYVGPGYGACSLSMHKGWIKSVVEKEGIFTAKYITIPKSGWRDRASFFEKKMEEELTFPSWVKGAHLGSSLGVFPVENLLQARNAIEAVFQMDDALIIEEHFAGKMVEFAMMGTETIQVSVAGEVLNEGEFYSYEKKYGKEAIKTQVPARIPLEWMKKGKDIAKRVYEIVGLQGMARIDFFVDDWGNFCFLEVNPFPGCTSISLFPLLWKKEGFSYENLVKRLLLFAKQRDGTKQLR